MTQSGVNIGIDLGTTYSSISFYNVGAGAPEPVKENGNTTSFASVVVIKKSGSNGFSYITGPPAKNNPSPYALDNSKRLIGKTYDEYERLGSEKDSFTFDVEKDGNNYCMMSIPSPVDKNGVERFYPEEVSSFVLKDLIEKTKNITHNSKFGKVVITIPVKFSAQQRQATIRACKIAGLKNVDMVNEPSASLIEYKRYVEKSPNASVRARALRDGQVVFVIDFGGGTLDVCCGRIKNIEGRGENVIDIIQTDGDQDCGGNHFDQIIKKLILDKLDSEQRAMLSIKPRDTQKVKNIKKGRMQKLMVQCEKAKIELSSKNIIQIPLESFLGEDYIDEEDVIISVGEFEEECLKELIPRFEKCMKRVLNDSRLSKEDIDLVLPIGGTCRVPIVMETIRRLFPNERQMAESTFDPLTAVANGAAYHAHRLSINGDSSNDLREKLPYTIGIDCVINGVPNMMDVHARKGDPIPLESSDFYWLNRDYQEYANYQIFSGESQKTTDPGMKHLKSLRITIPPKTKSSDFQMEATMKISSSGLIQFEVKKVKDGKHLGSLPVQLEMYALDEKLNYMSNHMSKFFK